LQRPGIEHEQRGVGQHLHIDGRGPADDRGDAQKVARARVADGDLAPIRGCHIDAEQPRDHEAAARRIRFVIQGGAGGEISRDRIVGEGCTQGGRERREHALGKRALDSRGGEALLAGHGVILLIP
jgi:hypothetical protein